MRKMFLVLGIMLLFIAIQASVYAVEVFIGWFAGTSIFRGSDADIFAPEFGDKRKYTHLPTA